MVAAVLFNCEHSFHLTNENSIQGLQSINRDSLTWGSYNEDKFVCTSFDVSFTMVLDRHPAYLGRVNILRLCKISPPLVSA